jgi:hypothetical protein
MQARSNSLKFRRPSSGALGQYLSSPVVYFNSDRPECGTITQLPVDLIHSVVMRGLDPRIHHLCKIYAKKMDPRGSGPRVTVGDG